MGGRQGTYLSPSLLVYPPSSAPLGVDLTMTKRPGLEGPSRNMREPRPDRPARQIFSIQNKAYEQYVRRSYMFAKKRGIRLRKRVVSAR